MLIMLICISEYTSVIYAWKNNQSLWLGELARVFRWQCENNLLVLMDDNSFGHSLVAEVVACANSVTIKIISTIFGQIRAICASLRLACYGRLIVCQLIQTTS